MYLTFTDSENMGNKLSLLDDYSMHLARENWFSSLWFSTAANTIFAVVNLKVLVINYLSQTENPYGNTFLFLDENTTMHLAKVPNLSYRNCRKQTNKIPNSVYLVINSYLWSKIRLCFIALTQNETLP